MIMIKCSYCNNRQVTQKGKKLVPCPYCFTEEKLISSIKRAIDDANKEGKKDFAAKLQSVLNFLPDYPVMAILQAEAYSMNNSLILMIRDSFNILPFGDQEYKK